MASSTDCRVWRRFLCNISVNAMCMGSILPVYCNIHCLSGFGAKFQDGVLKSERMFKTMPVNHECYSKLLNSINFNAHELTLNKTWFVSVCNCLYYSVHAYFSQIVLSCNCVFSIAYVIQHLCEVTFGKRCWYCGAASSGPCGAGMLNTMATGL